MLILTENWKHHRKSAENQKKIVGQNREIPLLSHEKPAKIWGKTRKMENQFLELQKARKAQTSKEAAKLFRNLGKAKKPMFPHG